MRRIPWWAVASAGVAPVLLIGGWSLAEARQPPGYNPIRDTISALAALGATDRWVMTSALAGLGACHVVTATGLRPARRGGRIVLGAGGAATVLVAAFPQPAHGNSAAHTVAATVAFVSLGAWPVLAARRRAPVPLMRRLPSALASGVLLGLVVWFAAELHGGQRGLAERVASGAQALWPLLVVLAARRVSPPPFRLTRPTRTQRARRLRRGRFAPRLSTHDRGDGPHLLPCSSDAPAILRGALVRPPDLGLGSVAPAIRCP